MAARNSPQPFQLWSAKRQFFMGNSKIAEKKIKKRAYRNFPQPFSWGSAKRQFFRGNSKIAEKELKKRRASRNFPQPFSWGRQSGNSLGEIPKLQRKN